MATVPSNSLGLVDGQYYKIGRLDRVFYWNEFEWMPSSKTKEYLVKELKRIERIRVGIAKHRD